MPALPVLDDPPEPVALARERRRYAALQQAIAQVGFFRRGTLVRIYERCGKPGCRCAADPPQLHGPYMRWTRKVAGKTVSVRVRTQQVKLFREWIANSRRLDRLQAQMQKVSMRATERLLRQADKSGARPARRSKKRSHRPMG